MRFISVQNPNPIAIRMGRMYAWRYVGLVTGHGLPIGIVANVLARSSVPIWMERVDTFFELPMALRVFGLGWIIRGTIFIKAAPQIDSPLWTR